jgi:hypothetical protein
VLIDVIDSPTESRDVKGVYSIDLKLTDIIAPLPVGEWQFKTLYKIVFKLPGILNSDGIINFLCFSLKTVS